MDTLVATLASVVPWGSTLRPRTVGRAAVFFESPDGRLWESTRHALLVQELGWCICEDQTHQLELMRIVLKAVAADLHRIDPECLIAELFGGSRRFFEFYMQDLTSREFVEHEAVVFRHARLSSLGWAVLALLEATKQPLIAGETAAATASLLATEQIIFS